MHFNQKEVSVQGQGVVKCQLLEGDFEMFGIQVKFCGKSNKDKTKDEDQELIVECLVY